MASPTAPPREHANSGGRERENQVPDSRVRARGLPRLLRRWRERRLPGIPGDGGGVALRGRAATGILPLCPLGRGGGRRGGGDCPLRAGSNYRYHPRRFWVDSGPARLPGAGTRGRCSTRSVLAALRPPTRWRCTQERARTWLGGPVPDGPRLSRDAAGLGSLAWTWPPSSRAVRRASRSSPLAGDRVRDAAPAGIRPGP